MCLISILGDHEGSHSISCCRTGTTFLPCRMCEISRENMMMSNIDDQVMRESIVYNSYLKEEFSAFCAYCTKNLGVVIKKQRSIIDFCKSKSIACLFPALNSL